MKIILMSSDKTKEKVIGHSQNQPIPHIGERVFCGYAPAPTVTDVIYIYEEDTIAVVVDSPFIEVKK